MVWAPISLFQNEDSNSFIGFLDFSNEIINLKLETGDGKTLPLNSGELPLCPSWLIFSNSLISKDL